MVIRLANAYVTVKAAMIDAAFTTSADALAYIARAVAYTAVVFAILVA